MKKLFVITLAICVTCMAQATTWSWKLAGTAYMPGDSTKVLSSGTAYLIDASTITQQSLLTLFIGGTTDISGKAVSVAPTVAITSGANAGTTAEFSYGSSVATTYYAA